MTKQNTKRALLLSTFALLICFTMLIGTTFAWFTDTASNSGNRIIAGTLKVDLLMDKDKDGTYTSIKDGNGDIFSESGNGINWEPGKTEIVYLAVKNLGSLALKYNIQLNITDGGLIGSLEYAIIDGAKAADLANVSDWATLKADANIQTGDVQAGITTAAPNGRLAKNGIDYFALAVHMKESAGNEYQDKDITIDVTVLATQLTSEEDSFDNQYDKDAVYPWGGTANTSWYNETDTTFEIHTAEELAGLSFLASQGNNFSGKTITLMNSVDLSGLTWTPIASFAGEFDGNGNTISNFEIVATDNRGGFFNVIEAGEGERVHDLIIKSVNATVGNNRFGTLANSIQGIVNRVTVEDVNVTTTHSEAWVGGMCAFMSWPWLNDCTVKNMVVDATDGATFVAGFSPILQKNSNMVFTNCDVNGFKVTITDTDGCGVGGFVSQTQTGWQSPSLLNCDITGIDIIASGNVDIGGFMPWPGGHTIAENCTTEGKIDALRVTNSSNFVGGFFGNLGWNADLGQMGHKLTNCTADVDIVSGGASAGGFVGSATNSNDNSMYATFINCSAKGDISNTNGVAGGFAGEADRGDYDKCSASGTVSGKIAGGFIGQIKDVTPKYDGRYPAGTRDYLVDEIFIDDCTCSTGIDFIGKIDEGTNVTIDGIKQ